MIGKWWIGGILVAASAVVLMAGCAAPHKEVELIWPLPPEQPRIKYLYSISSEDDVKDETFGKKIKEAVIGKDAASQLIKPYAVSADRDGRIFVADSAWGKVLLFDKKNHKFSIIGEDGAGVLNKPLGVTTDSSNNIYVTDSVENRVVMYDRDGKFIKAMGKEGVFDQPVGLALNEALGLIYVVDTKKHNVQVLDMEGNVVKIIGQRGVADGELNFPTNIAVGKDGTVYVMDSFNFRVQIFDKDGNGDISAKEMRDQVAMIYKERKDIESSLRVR